MAPAWRNDFRGEETQGRRQIEANIGGNLKEALDDFLELKEFAATRDGDDALHDQPRMVSRFYDVVTKFYEYGWGSSFHFAPRRSGEGLHAAQRRQEADVAELLDLGPGTRAVDIGCGVGGPLINIAKATGASITGLNFNTYQIARGRRAARRAGIQRTCDFLLANYMDVPLQMAPSMPRTRSKRSATHPTSFFVSRRFGACSGRRPDRSDRVVPHRPFRRSGSHASRRTRPRRVRERDTQPSHRLPVRRCHQRGRF